VKDEAAQRIGLRVYDFGMPTLNDVTAALRQIAPLELAADWDAVGLLVGSRRQTCERVMTCLTLTQAVAEEAASERVDLVITHHPLPFRPIARITDDTPYGSVLLTLLSAGVAVWSSHTAWDSAAGGINDQLANLLGLSGVRPILPHPELPAAGTGRMGTAPGDVSVGQLAARLATALAAPGCQAAGDASRAAGTVGIVCGSGGEMLGDLIAAGCTTLVTGEVRLHTAAEAAASGVAVIAVGHHASEHFSMVELGRRLKAQVGGLTTWASRGETDPLGWIPAGS
jgi:dinuclear metal center YbgI/SA1388 family protein